MYCRKFKHQFEKREVRNIFICFLLSLSFQMNLFRAVSFDRFSSFQADSQALVVGRLVYSDEKGAYSRSGLLGLSSPVAKNVDIYNYQYRAFTEKLPISDFEPYNSQPGIQGLIYYLLLHLSPFHGWGAILFLQCIVSLFTAIILTYWIDWLYREWGESVAWCNVLFIITGSYIVLFARNLYWVLGAFYIPFIVSLKWLEKDSRVSNRSLFHLFRAFFLAFLVKGLLTGFEYVSTICLMTLLPFLYYGIRDQWEGRKFLRRIIAASAGIGAGVIATAIVLIVQLIPEKDSLKEAVNYLWYSLGKRSYAEVSSFTFDEYVETSIRSDLWKVLQTYFEKPVWDISHLITIEWIKPYVSWTVFDFVVLFVFISIVSVSYVVFHRNFTLKMKAMGITLCFSIIPPLSWFVLFKGHSFVHTPMNAIVWSMPFLLWGIAWVAICIKSVFLPENEKCDDGK